MSGSRQRYLQGLEPVEKIALPKRLRTSQGPRVRTVRVMALEPTRIRRVSTEIKDVTDPVNEVLKADYTPLKTNMSERDAKRVTGRYGVAGALPKDLTREQRMGAYEARYVASGGRKGEKWQHRATAADRVKTSGLAVATAGGAGILAARAPKLRNLAAMRHVAHHADAAALGGATVGGAGELYGNRARKKRASYSSAPGGAAASALRRMRAMDTARGQS